jgi:pilus assembly protein CpaE
MTAENNNSHRSLRLIVIDSDKNARGYLKGYLGEKGIRVIGEAEDIKTGHRLVRGLQPDVVLVELPESASETVEFVKRVREELPGTGVIVAKHQPSPQVILGCIRAGAQEFVGRPLDAPDIERALDHVRRLMERTTANGNRRGTVLSVFSSKGGIGATSMAANLAVALTEQPDTRTVLVDMSFQLGDLGLMFNLPPRYSLTDALDEDNLDESKLRSTLSIHESGVSLLTVAASPEIGEEISRHHIAELFGVLNTMFDFVIVDVGRHLDDRTIEALELSDGILLMSTLDVPTIRNVSKYLDIFERLELNREKIHLIVNRFNKKSRLGLKDMEKALGVEVFWTVPNDFEPMSLGIDEGTPAILEAPRSKLAQSFKELAEHYCQIFAARQIPPTIEATN